MNLKDLLSALPEFDVSRAFRVFPESLLLKNVEKLEMDSRRVDSASIFVAIRGSHCDTHRFIPDVLERKPLAIVGERFSGMSSDNAQTFLLRVPDSRGALSALAARWSGDPSREMLTLGVTGTNGKTSSVYLLEHLLQTQGLLCGVMGTVDHHLGQQTWEASLTTPDPVQLQQRLREFRRLGAQACALEVSSHALDQKRVEDVHFNCVGFTNFTRDHLDYHLSLKRYFEAKQRLFTEVLWRSQKEPVYSVLNAGDPWIRKLEVSARSRVWSFGESPSADFQYRILDRNLQGIRWNLKTPLGRWECRLPVVGDFFVANAVLAVTMLSTQGFHPETLLKALENFAGVPGRLQRVPGSYEIPVFVDYAHTPDALEKACAALRALQPKRLLLVFGCGGDRDRGKRALMGRVADLVADLSILTSDNPRTEDPQLILREISQGFTKNSPLCIVDRKEAMDQALQRARPGDVVLVAGKGHEKTQEIAGQKWPFDDVQVLQELLKSMGAPGERGRDYENL